MDGFGTTGFSAAEPNARANIFTGTGDVVMLPLNATVYHAPCIVFEKTAPDAQLPVRATSGSAGHDAFAYLKGRTVKLYDPMTNNLRKEEIGVGGELTLYPGMRAIVPLGFKATLPNGFEAQVRARSSWAFKRGLLVPNAPGTIDSDYPDEWGVILMNVGRVKQVVQHGDRCAQIVLSAFATMPWVEGRVGVTTERTGGVGSTG